MNHKKTSFIY